METKRRALGRGLEELFNNEPLNMTEMEEKIIKELSVKYNKKESVLRVMLNDSKELNYNIMQFENLIEEFLTKK